MTSLIVFLIIFGILIIVHEFGHFMAAKLQGVKVEEFSLGFGPRLFKKKTKVTEYRVNAIPLGGYVKFAGDSLVDFKGEPDEYYSKKPGQRALIIFCGPLLNYILGIFCFCFIFFVGFPALTPKIGGLIDGYGAKKAGLQAGDKIISIDGQNIRSWDELQVAVFNKEASSKLKIDFLRDGKNYSALVELKPKELQDSLGEKRSVGLLGITPDVDETIKVKYGFIESIGLGFQKTWNLTILTYKAIWRLITGKLSLKDSVTGPLGMFYITSKAKELGILSLLNLIGIISVSLAIFNLLPLPILDGGHIFLLGIEKIRGKNLSPKTEQIITQVGLTLIITLALFVTYNDILRFKDKIVGLFIK